jgi:hypothetical protein
MFDFSRHKWIRVFLKNAQASAGAEIDPLTPIDGARIIGWVFEFTSAGGLIFRRWGGGLGQILVILMIRIAALFFLNG